jgi:hypothetical protein
MFEVEASRIYIHKLKHLHTLHIHTCYSHCYFFPVAFFVLLYQYQVHLIIIACEAL